MSDADAYFEQLRENLLARIDQNARKHLTIKITTLMGDFGSTATQRVRQDYLLWVLEELTAWGIAYQLTGTTAHDYITLSRSKAPIQTEASVIAPSAEESFPILDLKGNTPLAFLFQIDGVLDAKRSRQLALDVQSAIWAFHPVCLFVEASDEFFGFICGFVSAVLRRRARMIRSHAYDWSIPMAPEIITVDSLKHILGHISSPEQPSYAFPTKGSVYLLRQDVSDIEDDDLVNMVREYFLPHTYHITARFLSTTGGESPDRCARDEPGCGELFRWIAAFAGTLQVSPPLPDQPVDVSRLLAEAAQLRDTLLERQTCHDVDAEFRGGFESTEHMVLKSAILNGVRRRYPGEKIAVEEVVESADDQDLDDAHVPDRPRRDKPDLLVGNKIWIEVETLRGLARMGSNPFFELERKLRQKLGHMRPMQEIWLLVPSDVALLATEQIAAVARHVNSALGDDKVRYGFVDMLSELPVFLAASMPPEKEAVRLSGISIRRKPDETVDPLTWSDIAGYTDVRERLQGDVLDPLLNPERYREFGLVAANGVLLYGLPGCGKSLIGRVLAGVAGMTCRYVMPSDLSSMWLHESVAKTRDLFDWALKQAPCLLVLDELDALAPQRREHNMHSDEKRQVNELLTQLDRMNGRNVIVVATTNYLRGIDTAIRRSGRFDLKVPIFPPDQADRQAIFDYYLTPPRLHGFAGISGISTAQLAAETFLFTPADIKVVVQTAARQAIRQTTNTERPFLNTRHLLQTIQQQPRSIQPDIAEAWIEEAAHDLGQADRQITWLREEIQRAFGGRN